MSLCFSSYLFMALLLYPLHTIRRVHLYPNTTMLALATLRRQHFHICLNLHCYSTPTYSLDALLLVMDAEYFHRFLRSTLYVRKCGFCSLYNIRYLNPICRQSTEYQVRSIPRAMKIHSNNRD